MLRQRLAGLADATPWFGPLGMRRPLASSPRASSWYSASELTFQRLKVAPSMFRTASISAGHHSGMVLVVVLVHAVASDDVQVCEIFASSRSDRVQMGLVPGAVDGIRLLHPHDSAPADLLPPRLDKAQAAERARACPGLDQVPSPATSTGARRPRSRNTPSPRRGRARWPPHHGFAPVLEVLNPPHLHFWLVDVDPVVRERVFALDDEGDREEIPVAQRAGAAATAAADRGGSKASTVS